ncbi:MAG: asparagine synthase (glutamine-hydrolyzing) [Bacillota bacterium]
MCGIVGWVDRERDLRRAGPIVEAMVRTLTPRGPDEEGIWLSPRAALGHRRLIVVDPAGGRQPMFAGPPGGRFVITYNGELYNTEELRRELKALGYTFRGRSDTEVVLLAYLAWGPECVTRFNGIFAFGIWNEADESLFLARDRLGVKPLFYTERGSAFLFASELKALLAHPEVPPEVDLEGLAEIFLLGPARTPGYGVFRGIKELRAGYCLLHRRESTRVWPYWRLESRPHEDDPETTAARVRELLHDAVARQLVADVPVCVLLSGGLDSSAVAAFAREALRSKGDMPLVTYSIDYEGNEEHFRPNSYQPEADGPWVEIVSRALGTEHHRVVVGTEEVAAALGDALRARDLPGMADIDSSLLLFCRAIKRGATVALSGESADELFGGYPWFHLEEALAFEGFPWARTTALRASLLHPELRAAFRRERFVRRRYRETLAEVPHLPGENVVEARRRNLFYLNLTWFLGTLLERKDRMSMATGLEVRVPFCDHRLVEYVWNVPWAIKTIGGEAKGLLRRALRGLLPEPVLRRRKSPYPKTHHPAYLRLVRDGFARLLEDPSSPLIPLLDREAAEELVRTNGAAFEPAWFGQLMGGAQIFAYLIQVDAWLREYGVRLV